MRKPAVINKSIFQAATLAAVALFAAAVFAADTKGPPAPAGTTLRYHFQKGERYVLVSSGTNQDRIEKLADQTVTSNVSESGRTICWLVGEVSPQGTADVKMIFLSNWFEKYKDGRLACKLNSANATGNDPRFLQSKVFSKSPLQFTITSRGQITKITGVDEAVDRYRNMVEKATQDRDIRSELDQELEESCSEESIRSTLTELLDPYPEGPVKKGDTWDNSISLPMEGVKVSGRQHFRLESDPAPGSLFQVATTSSATIIPQLKNVEVDVAKAVMTRLAGRDFQTGLPMQQVDRQELDLTTYSTSGGQRQPLVHVVVRSRSRLTIMKGEASDYSSNGYTLAEKKKSKEALADLDKAIAVQPDCALLYAKRGDVRRMFEDYPGAINDFDRAIKLDPELDEAYRGRGCARTLAKDLPGAIADYTELIRRQSELWRYYYLRAGLYEDQKKYDLALADLKAALERYSDNPDLYHARAVVYWKAGNKSAGDADMARFNELNSDQK